jgi:hypothetical protein
MTGGAKGSIRTGRIAWLVLLIGVVLGAVLAAPLAVEAWEARRERLAAEPHPIPADDAEQAAILAALFRTGDLRNPPPPPDPDKPPGPPDTRLPALLDTSMYLCDSEEPPLPGAACAEGRRSSSVPLDPGGDLPLKLRQELILANQHPRRMMLPRIDGLELASSEEVERVFAQDQRRGWQTIDRMHPRSIGLVEVSVAVLTPDRNQALIVVSLSCGMGCASAGLYELVRVDGVWRTQRTQLLWMA